MKRRWYSDELIANFTLSSQDRSWLSGHTPAVQLGRAVLLTCMQYEGRFPHQARDVPEAVIAYLGQQLGLPVSELEHYDWLGRRGQMDRESIRQRLGFRVVNREDYANLVSWLSRHPILQETHEMGHLRNTMLDHLREQGVEPPSAKQLDR